MRGAKLQNRTSCWRLGTWVAVMMALSAVSQAQAPRTYKQGQPLVGSNPTNNGNQVVPVSSQLVVDASQFLPRNSSDACAAINAAWRKLMLSTKSSYATMGGVVDARAFTGDVECNSKPFPSCASDPGLSYPVCPMGVLLLGNARIGTTAEWIVPSRVRVEGVGEGTPFNATNGSLVGGTLIYAASGFNTGIPVIQMGQFQYFPATTPASSGGGTNPYGYGVQIENLSVDCNGVTGCIGILNDSSQEDSWIRDVIVFNAPAYGIRISTNNCGSTVAVNGAENSGPYRDISIQYSSSGCSQCGGAIGLLVDGAPPTSNSCKNPNTAGIRIRGFDNITVAGGAAGGGPPAIGIFIYGIATSVSDSHAENFSQDVVIGSTNLAYPTFGVKIDNVSLYNQQVPGTGITIVNPTNNAPSNSQDIFVEGITGYPASGKQQILVDQVNGNTVTGGLVGWYLLGDGSTLPLKCLTSVVGTSNCQ